MVANDDSMAELPNTEKSPFSPQIPEDEFGIWLTKGPELQPEGEEHPVILLGAYRITPKTDRKYGGNILNGILILAVEAERLQIYKGVFNEDVIPLDDLIPRVSEEPKTDQDSALLAVEGYFNFDLKQICHLPDAAAEYFVFAVLEEYKTETLVIEIE